MRNREGADRPASIQERLPRPAGPVVLPPAEGAHAVLVYSRPVRAKRLDGGPLKRQVEMESILSVVGALKDIGARRPLEDLELSENCKNWIEKVLTSFSNDDRGSLDFILNDFTDSMMTRMRESDKHAIAIVAPHGLLLCHSKTGETTITPKWQVVKRMLDKDNVERFVLFEIDHGQTFATFFERYASESFANWLGIPEKESFYYLGGKNRIYVRVEGMKGALEFSDDDLEKQLLGDEGLLRMERNQIQLRSPIDRFPIEQIRVGTKVYKNAGDFLQDFLARRYELSSYKEAYERIAGSLDQFTNKFIDDADAVVKQQGTNSVTAVKKRNKHVTVLFAGPTRRGGTIEFRASYLAGLVASIVKGQPIRIFHAGMPTFDAKNGAAKIGSVEILNKLNGVENARPLIDLLESTELKDAFVHKAILMTAFALVAHANPHKPLAYVFDRIAGELGQDLGTPKSFAGNEGHIVEMKSRDIVVGTNEEISQRLALDIKKKLVEASPKVYVIGADEKTQRFEPLSTSKFPSDRIGAIEGATAKALGANAHVQILRVPFGEGLLLLIVARNKGSA